MSSRFADRRGRPARPAATHARRGAAMIIVIAIITILLAIALTFFTVTRLEVQTATNVRNIVDVDLLADAAIAITQAHLNEDLFRHPEYTSLDHGIFTLFNGAAWAGKDWAMASGGPSFRNKGTVEVDFSNLPIAVFDDGHEEVLYRGPYSENWLAIPRYEGNTRFLLYRGPEGQNVVGLFDQNSGASLPRVYFHDPDALDGTVDVANSERQYPFVTSTVYDRTRINFSGNPFPVPDKENGLAGDGGLQYAVEQIHEWADVDNDNDGFRDSVWIPLPRDQFFGESNADEDLDGLIDEAQDNGINDDEVYEALATVTRTDGGPTQAEIDANVTVAGFNNDPDEAIESGVFVYWAGADGLDNDRDGLIDEADSAAAGGTAPFEYDANDFTVGYFLTAPLPGLEIAVDFDADGVVPDVVPVDTASGVVFGELRVRLPDQVRVLVRNPNNISDVRALLLTAANVDRLDNDYDLTVNDYYTYAYVGPNERQDLPPFALRGFTDDAVPQIIFDNTAFNSYIQSASPQPPDFVGSFYAIWRHVGNWYVAGDNNTDADLFAIPRRRGYTDINADAAFDLSGVGTPNLTLLVKTSGGDIFSPVYNDPDGDRINYAELNEYLRITHSGEPVCELVGRMAVLVTDEVSKPNLNTIGGHTFTDEYDADNSNSANVDLSGIVGPTQRALGTGATPAEYESRILPNIGRVLSPRLHAFRMGSYNGLALPVSPDSGLGGTSVYTGSSVEDTDTTNRFFGGQYYYDANFPGYGRADDNGNAFLLSMNGKDDDGDGLVDEGVFLPELSANAELVLRDLTQLAAFSPDTQDLIAEELRLWTRYFRRLGHFEGIDEPGEFQSFAPHRHRIAEQDFFNGPLDNDDDNVANEIGEIGDRAITNNNQLQSILQIGQGISGELASLTTLHSSSKNTVPVKTDAGLRAINKLDYNYATPQQIAAASIIADQGVRPVTTVEIEDPNVPGNVNNYIAQPNVRAFAEGLRQAGTHLSAPGFDAAGYTSNEEANAGGFLFTQVSNTFYEPSTLFDRGAPLGDSRHRLPADPLLREMQKAVNIVDNRDRNHARSVLTSEYRNLVVEDGQDGVNFVNFPVDLNGRERIPDRELFPVEPIEQQLEGVFGETSGRRLEALDGWWANPDLFQGLRGLAGQAPLPELRHISYTTAGIDSIVINELMVRPVRRVEAEMIANSGTLASLQLDPSPSIDLGQMRSDLISGASTGRIVLPYFDVIFSQLVNIGADYTPVIDSGWTQNGVSAPAVQILGDETWLETDRKFMTALFDEGSGPANPDNGVVYEIGDTLQYVISPSDGLPPGRYYLTVNIDDTNLGAGDRLEYAIKYIDVLSATADLNDDRTIQEDILNELALQNSDADADPPDVLEGVYFDRFWARPQDAHYSHVANVDGEPAGWVFIDGTPTAATSNNPNLESTAVLNASNYYTDGGSLNSPILPGFSQGFSAPLVNLTSTVTIPPAGSGIALCIAFRKANTGAAPLAINFLDFSQEPDHEYVELANNSDDEIDLSNWRLEVGIPDSDGVPNDPNKSVWEVPANTRIAPRGMLLLGFDKFDRYLSGGATSLINNNGMGLASGGSPLDVPNLTEVTMPFHGLDSNDPRANEFANGLEDRFAFDTINEDITPPFNPRPNDPSIYDFTTLANLYDPTGSVFRRFDDTVNTPLRNEFVDYVDNSGDGVSSLYRYANEPERFTSDPVVAKRDGFFLDTDRVGAESETVSTFSPLEPGDPNKPWDRIVGLNSVSLPQSLGLLEDITTVDQVARLVLRGGMLPNYPERDGIDNDGDGGYVVVRNVGGIDVPEYILGTLDKDMVDNDFDGLIDEFAPGTDADGNGIVDDLDGDFDLLDEVRPEFSEGVDEGGPVITTLPGVGNFVWRRYGPGSYDVPANPGFDLALLLGGENADVLPVSFFKVRNFGPRPVDYLDFVPLGLGNHPYMTGIFADVADPTSLVKGIDANYYGPSQAENDGLVERLGDFADNALPLGPSGQPYINRSAQYLGSDRDPADWKEFTERRWNPGDNVVVSLLDSTNSVVDRVTYRELDVTNRTIDDIIESPYGIDIDGNGNPDDDGNGIFDDPASLHPDFHTFWRPDHMALDFYRALERKHPMYPGDRFGTTNRWQATDGNYDDWADSPSFFEGIVLTDDRYPYQKISQFPTRFSKNVIPESSPGFTTARAYEHERLYRHAMFGSPLRMNLSHRLIENPVDIVRELEVLESIGSYAPLFADRSPLDAGRELDQFWSRDFVGERINDTAVDASTPLRLNLDWNYGRAVVRNESYTSPGDLLSVPEFIIDHAMMNTRVAAFESSIGGDGRFTWANTSDRLNYMSNLPFLHTNPAYRGATLGYDETNAAPAPVERLAAFSEVPNPLDTAAKLMATESLVLTVGQADFTPIRPNPFEMDLSDYPSDTLDGSEFKALMGWRELAGQPGSFNPPAAWMPIFLFSTDFDDFLDNSTFPPGKFPYYPSYPDGSNVVSFGITLLMDDPSLPILEHLQKYIFSQQYLFNTNHQASFTANMSQQMIAQRWPQDKRATFFVASQRNLAPGIPMNNDDRAEALFTWTAEDGLENGEYILYVGTFLPEVSETIQHANELFLNPPPSGEVPNVTPTGAINGTVPIPNDPTAPTQGILAPFGETIFTGLDPALDRDIKFDPVLGLDVITDRTRANGLAPQIINPVTPEDIAARNEFELTGELPPGLAHPNDWQPSTAYRPDSDGYIFYSDSAEGGWKPIIVRVTDNYLALRVRNLGAPGQVAAISHVVLAPRKRIPGKININTVTPKIVADQGNTGTNFEFFNSLLGLPGVVDVAGRILPTDDVDPLSVTVNGANAGFNQARPALSTFAGEPIPPLRNGGVDDLSDTFDYNLPDVARTQLSALMLWGRERHDGNEQFRDETHFDGRYYKRITDLVKESSNFPHPFSPPLLGDPNALDGESDNIYPLSNQNDPEARYDEVADRFRRMSNLITTRSDVFEIIATVQAGYGFDLNADGRIAYRSSEEFITTAETKTRMVYERRSPSESSDINDRTD